MALNYSHMPMRVGGNGCFGEGMGDRSGRDGGGGADSMDWESVLPADPFDMEKISSAITGMLRWFEADNGGAGCGRVVKEGGGGCVGIGDYSVVAELNLFFNKAALEFHPWNAKVDDRIYFDGRYEDLMNFDTSVGDGGCFGFDACTMEELSFDDLSVSSIFKDDSFGEVNGVVVGDDSDDGTPHQALSFALAYLGVRDLLNVERVCKTLRATVQGDPLLWKTIHIDQPLNERITDDILLKLTSQAQGCLRCLSLADCQRITDDGIKRVLESNPRLNKLSVPGCTRISIEGIINCLKDFKMVGVTGIKFLRIGGLYGVNEKHFEELVSLLGVHNSVEVNNHKPLFFIRGKYYVPCEENRPIDIEMCPRCQNFRLVYDCTAESCQPKDSAAPTCRACILCIPRCAQCGKCVIDGEYEETFCLELLCSHCWNVLLRSQEKQEIGPSPLKRAFSEVHVPLSDG